jgi:hypothetical protein
VTIYRNQGEHNHGGDSTKKAARGINEVTKNVIKGLFVERRVTTATAIVEALRDRKDQFMPKKFLGDPDIPNLLYVPGIVVPTTKSVHNWLDRQVRPECENGIKMNSLTLMNSLLSFIYYIYI